MGYVKATEKLDIIQQQIKERKEKLIGLFSFFLDLYTFEKCYTTHIAIKYINKVN